MLAKISRWFRIGYLKLKHRNDEYCGKCAVCVDLANDDLYEWAKNNDKFNIYQKILYDHNICFATMNKISRDGRYRDNIKLVKKY